jgi:hypothetical protein
MFFVLSSCQFSEHIYLNEDGTGKMEFRFDGSEIMQMAGDKMTGDSGNKDVDSTFTFKEVFEAKKDSIALLSKAEQSQLKAIENFTVHMLTNEAEKKFNMEVSTNFKKPNELKDMFTALSMLGNLNTKGAAKLNDPTNPFAAMAEGGNTDLNFSFKKGVFKREAKVIDKDLQEKRKDSLGELAIMFANSKYKVNYHLPRRVKSISNDKALFSADGKTVIIEYGLMDYIMDPEVMNLEIILED